MRTRPRRLWQIRAQPRRDVATVAQVNEYRTALDDLTTLSIADLSAALTALEGADPVLIRRTLIDALPDVVGPYVTSAGELTATWYEDLRAEAFGGTFYATTQSNLTDDRIDSLVRWGVRPLFDQSDSTPLSLIGGGVQRLIAGAARDTIDGNARQDPASVSWARQARPDACEFCTMLAGRGAVYRSREAAGMVIGRGVDPSATAGRRGGQGRGVVGRGNRAIGSDQYHDWCRCTAVPTYYEVATFINPRTGRTEPALVPIGE